MREREIIFMVEGRSEEVLIEILLSRLHPSQNWSKNIIKFQGKNDLDKRVGSLLQGYRNPEAVFFILRDQNGGDCRKIKNQLQEKCIKAGKENYIICIACRALESFYLGDLEAVGTAYQKNDLAPLQNKEKYRNPDNLPSPHQVLSNLVVEFNKIDAAQRIGEQLRWEGNLSPSYNHFIKKLKYVVSIKTKGSKGSAI